MRNKGSTDQKFKKLVDSVWVDLRNLEIQFIWKILSRDAKHTISLIDLAIDLYKK